MKKFFKISTAMFAGMALVFGFQYISFLETLLSTKAQTTTRMIDGGPHDYIFETNSQYLTPTSNTLNANLPTYVLPTFNVGSNSSQYIPEMLDLNADGLMDFAYSSYFESSTFKTAHQYVILNTGNGFNLAYICKYDYSGGVHTYKGDCAASE